MRVVCRKSVTLYSENNYQVIFMILLADSGSTKTTWALCHQGQAIATHTTIGLNPFHQSVSDISNTVAALPETMRHADSVRFYGAGCTQEKKECVANALRTVFAHANIGVESDMLGAAHALLQHERGIACILGTGANSCLYDGEQIVQNVPPLGYILGDEGSGAVIGKRFVGDCLKNQTPAALKQLFLDTYATSAADIVEHVYRQPQANRYLAQFAPFLSANIDRYDYIRTLVSDCFRDFFVRNVLQYDDAHALPIAFVGSVAYHFAAPLRNTAQALGLTISKIEQSPIAGLAEFYQ